MNQNFAVRPGFEAVAFAFKLGTQFPEVIDFAIAHQPNGFIDIRQRLMTTGQVNDRQAPHGNAARAVDVHALIVWPTVACHVAHG